jgi:hypothetical protein
MKRKFIIFLIIAIALGLLIAWIDSRPNWDDAGITAFMILFITIICGYFSVERPWLMALAVGIWIPLSGIILNHNFEGFIALIPAFIGSYIGFFANRKKTGH